MLIGLDPLLSGEILATLRDMGHGDTIAITDSNFPSHFLGPPVIRMDADLIRVGRAILSVMPLDAYVDWPLQRMEVIAHPSEITEVQGEFIAMVEEVSGPGWVTGSLERYAFYETARDCVAIVATQERRGYANFILHKGVIGPDGAVVRSGAGTRRGGAGARKATPRPLAKPSRR